MRPSTRMVVLGGRLRAPSGLWTPAALGLLLALWLDAADASTITLNGSTVSAWRDKSGNARHASQATTANQPMYIVSGLNGLSLLDWDGSNDSMTISGGNVPLHTALSGNNSHSVTILLNPDVLSNSPVFLSVPEGIWKFLIESNVSGLYWGYQSGNFRTYSSGFFNVNTPSFFTLNKTNTTTGNAYSNGFLQTSFSDQFTATPSLNSAFVLGNFPGFNYNGKFGEIIITTTALSTDDRQRLEGYLAHKWGLAANLPSDHPFKFTPPLA